MAATATATSQETVLAQRNFGKPGKLATLSFISILLGGIGYTAWHLGLDLSGIEMPSILPFGLLGLALTIALGFEFVNGFHDTANAVATVIYTHTLEPQFAVMWSGVWNFLGVLTSGGAVAFGILALLPIDLILQVGKHTGFAMVFALLISAILWNLGTWYLGIPSSSSHTLIGSMVGVGLANQLLATHHSPVTGIDWGQALNVGKSLFFSPLIGFACSALLLLVLKYFWRNKELYQHARPGERPPLMIRGLLLLTCTGVSFAHGSNDGQKGMGLIMLILVGTVPTAYALNRAVDSRDIQNFAVLSDSADRTLSHYAIGSDLSQDPREEVERYITTRDLTSATVPALRSLIGNIKRQVTGYKTLRMIPTQLMTNVRNDMYLATEAVGLLTNAKTTHIERRDLPVLKNYKKQLDRSIKFIPTWVKVIVALALGLGTVVGWKRVVITVGERIGKQHLSYAQGASSELVAMGTIMAADHFGLPVSTTHVLTSGVAGTMVANGAGLQWRTLRNLLLAWVLTLPASILLSGGLFYLFTHLFQTA